MVKFTQYRRKQIAELRPWMPGDDMTGVSVSQEDVKAGSPKAGDMIARNPKNHADQWLVAAAYFADNFEPVAEAETEANARLIAAIPDLLDTCDFALSILEALGNGKGDAANACRAAIAKATGAPSHD